jgi:ribosomal protein S18 acetylase RimI-like enzyme
MTMTYNEEKDVYEFDNLVTKDGEPVSVSPEIYETHVELAQKAVDAAYRGRVLAEALAKEHEEASNK